MKKLYIFSLAIISFVAVSGQSWTKPEYAKKHNGKTVNVIGHVSKVERQVEENTKSTRFRLIGADSTQFLNLIILNPQLQAGNESPELAFLHKYIHVKGKIRTFNGNPQIILNSFKEIAVLRESEMNRYWLEPE